MAILFLITANNNKKKRCKYISFIFWYFYAFWNYYVFLSHQLWFITIDINSTIFFFNIILSAKILL